MTGAALLAVAGCLAVGAGADHILLRDLAPAFSGLDTSATDSPVGFAPAPGVRRVFRLPELGRIAARFNVSAPEQELCFERPVTPLDPARLRDVMMREFPQARIQILDYSRVPAPDGELQFPAAGLRETPAGGFWNGSIRYAGNRRFAVWARVKVIIRASRVIAAADLRPGSVMDAAQLRTEAREESPGGETFAASVDEIAGRVLRRPVRAGTALRREWFDAPKDVLRGQAVRVEVRNGGALLEMEAQAEAAGFTGQVIPVRNPESKKRFLARIEGKGRVSVGL